MHPQSGLRLLAPFLAFLTNAAADTSAPFELISHVLHPPNPTLDGLYYASFDFHPGGFYFGTISDPSVLSPLVSFLNGTAEELAAGNGTLETTDIPGDSETYAFDISPGVPNYAPSVYDYVGLNPPGEVVTFGLHFVNGVLKYKGLKGHFYACLSNPPTPQGELTPPPGVHRLFYKPANHTTPAGCSTLQLIREPA